MPSYQRPLIRHSATDTGRHIARKIGLSCLSVALFAGSFTGLAYHDLQSQVTRVDVSSMVGTTRPTRAVQADIPDDYAGVAVNILVMGIDTRSGENNIDGTDGRSDVAGARSDTTMVLHLSADRTRIEVVSIPRDTLVSVPACTQADGAQTSASSQGMFNSAFANGAGQGSDTESIAAGAACTLKTVERMTNLRIDEFVVVDFAGLQRMIDALGGVTVYVDEPINDVNNTKLVIDAGCHTFDGAQGLAYARARHGVGDGSDLSRITRQQNLMGAMIRTAQQKNLLSDADDLYSFARQALSTLTTSEKLGSLTTLAGLAQSIKQIGMENVHFLTMPVTTAPSNPNRVVATAQAELVWEALINDQVVPTDTDTLDATGATVAPSQTSSSESAPTTSDTSATASASASDAAPTLSPREQCYADN